MGEAKRKLKYRERFFVDHPRCCFCGGLILATTIDHVPSRQMFFKKHRPQGLEVLACRACNDSTRLHEQVAAMLGRIYPDGTTELERDEASRIMNAVNNNAPGLLLEMQPARQQELQFIQDRKMLPPDAAGVLNVNGPLLNDSIQIFGAKLGFALHYKHQNMIVPKSGGVAVRWYSNYDALTCPAFFVPGDLREFAWTEGARDGETRI